jgi:hypothetical protein
VHELANGGNGVIRSQNATGSQKHRDPALYLLVEALGSHATGSGELSFEQHSMAAQHEDGACELFGGDWFAHWCS